MKSQYIKLKLLKSSFILEAIKVTSLVTSTSKYGRLGFIERWYDIKIIGCRMVQFRKQGRANISPAINKGSSRWGNSHQPRVFLRLEAEALIQQELECSIAAQMNPSTPEAPTPESTS